MEWLTLVALLAAAVAFFVAAEHAHELRGGGLMPKLALVGALLMFLLTLALLGQAGLPGEFARPVAVVICFFTMLGCFWKAKTSADEHRPIGLLVAAVLGLTIFALGFFVWFGVTDAPTPPAVAGAEGDSHGAMDLTSADPDTAVRAQIHRFLARRRDLEKRLEVDIPAYERRLAEQLYEVKQELTIAPESNKPRLTDELREIARLLVAVEKEKQQTASLISRVRGELRRLERYRDSRNFLVDDKQLQSELDHVWAEAGAAIAEPVDKRIGSGAISELQVEEKLNQLLTGDAPGGT